MMQTRETRVNKWGTSLGVRLPKEFTDLFGIEHKSKIKMEMKDGALQITPVTEPRKRKPLSEILNEAQENGTWDGKPAVITAEDREWLDMPSVGDEVVT